MNQSQASSGGNNLDQSNVSVPNPFGKKFSNTGMEDGMGMFN